MNSTIVIYPASKQLLNNSKKQLALFKENNRAAVKKLFYEYYPILCSIIFQIIKDKEIAKDLAQDTFLKFWKKRQKINIHISLKGYLRKMAINEALEYLRAKKNSMYSNELNFDIIDYSENVEEWIVWNELDFNISAAINDLPARCGEIFKMNRYEGMTYKMIAQKLNISEKTVESHMGKALRRLRVAFNHSN